jgi:hypothetical protein
MRARARPVQLVDFQSPKRLHLRLNGGAAVLDERSSKHCQRWNARFDELDPVVEGLQRKERVDGRRKK